MKTITLNIEGMHCNSCAKLIEEKISSLKGVEKVEVDIMEDNAKVWYDPEVISLDKIKSEISMLGYPVEGVKKDEKKKSLLQGIAYGIIPHIGCIAFILFSVLGVTAAASFFKPLLMSPYFFYILIVMSFLFATISAVVYLRRNDLLSIAGIKKKKGYLLTMYGTTIIINLLLFMVVFPYAANLAIRPDDVSSGSASLFSSSLAHNVGKITLKVSIPCPGHAPLITGELYKIVGVSNVEFGFPNYFDITYDGSKTSKEEILSLEVFKTYKAIITSENIQEQQSNTIANSCGCGSCGL